MTGEEAAARRPRLAASIACFRDGAVLIARRGRAPNRGLWSLPGGGIEFGETGAAAALRELREETAVEADVVGLADVVEVIDADRHAVILAYAGRWRSGEPALSDEAQEIAWVSLETLADYDTTPGLATVVRRAAELAA